MKLSTLKKLRGKVQGFSLRGLLVFVGSLYLFFGPAQFEADLAAGTIGAATAAISVLFLILTYVFGAILRKRLSVSIHPPGEKLYSKIPLLFVYRTTRVSVPPLWVLKLKIHFEQPYLKAAGHELQGLRTSAHSLSEQITFPHRGIWNISHFEAIFTDRLGLTSLQWNVPVEPSGSSIQIKPPPASEISLPVISSSHRSGETAVSSEKRSGDPFDLKPYHPSDGVRKILWKIYAKSGELLSRHPEPALTPEGTVVVFAMAGKDDDAICGAVLNYLKKLEGLDLDIFFGCEGMSQNISTDLKHSLSRDPPRDAQAAEKLLIDTVWNTTGTTAESLRNDLELLLEKVNKSASIHKLDKIIVFASPARFSLRKGLALTSHIGDMLDDLGTRPVFCLKDSIDAGSVLQTRSAAKDGFFEKLKDLAVKLMVETSPQSAGDKPYFLPEFLNICSAKKWEVII